jgi:hypothetical protein
VRRVADIREGIPPDGPGEQPERHQQRERPETRHEQINETRPSVLGVMMVRHDERP